MKREIKHRAVKADRGRDKALKRERGLEKTAVMNTREATPEERATLVATLKASTQEIDSGWLID
jgi:hypothetical protein